MLYLPTPARQRMPLGQMLVESGELSPGDHLHTLASQSRAEARYGRILRARGLIGKTQLYAAIARQYDTEVADFDATPPDIGLIDTFGVERCLNMGLLPWQRRDGRVLIATARPEQFAEAQPQLQALFGAVRMVVASEADLHGAILCQPPTRLAERAETRVAPQESCRAWPSRTLPRLFTVLAIALIAGTVLAPATAFTILSGWAILTLAGSSALKLGAAAAQIRAQRQTHGTDGARPIIARMPAVSILVPLYKERAIAARLVKRLNRLDYPKELLDICLVVESDDPVTRDTLDAMTLPGHIRQIVVPASDLKTKPRALNYALDFCRGSIVGVYDAEDAPSPDQIHRVVRRFHERGGDVACLQGVLDFYNARTNWLSRCFAVEYAVWFRVILPGLSRLGLVIPLGGTTLFFRRAALEKLGGWDAHNVTEDADLGLRLARHGYRTELIGIVTEEEANCRFWPWIKQRSRWLKGYAITWAVHMRSPRKLWSDLGPWRFLGVQLLFVGTISQFLLAPLLWSFWMIPLGLPHPMQNAGPGWLFYATLVGFIASEAIGIAIGIYAVRAVRHRFLMPWVPTLYFYFPMAALASYKGVVELLTRPFFWDKTTHGVFDAPDAPDGASPPPRLRRRPA